MSLLLSSHRHYLLKNTLVRLCPPTGRAGNPSILVTSYAWGTSLNPQKMKYRMYVTVQAPTTVSQVGDKGFSAVLQDTLSASAKHKSQQVPNALSSARLQQPAPHHAHSSPAAPSPLSLLLHPTLWALRWDSSPALTSPCQPTLLLASSLRHPL